MTALAFDFDSLDGVATVPAPKRRLYAVRGSVDARPATPTLDALLGGAWSALTVGATAPCPVCTGTMRPRGCEDCGTTLS